MKAVTIQVLRQARPFDLSIRRVPIIPKYTLVVHICILIHNKCSASKNIIASSPLLSVVDGYQAFDFSPAHYPVLSQFFLPGTRNPPKDFFSIVSIIEYVLSELGNVKRITTQLRPTPSLWIPSAGSAETKVRHL